MSSEAFLIKLTKLDRKYAVFLNYLFDELTYSHTSLGISEKDFKDIVLKVHAIYSLLKESNYEQKVEKAINDSSDYYDLLYINHKTFLVSMLYAQSFSQSYKLAISLLESNETFRNKIYSDFEEFNFDFLEVLRYPFARIKPYIQLLKNLQKSTNDKDQNDIINKTASAMAQVQSVFEESMRSSDLIYINSECFTLKNIFEEADGQFNSNAYCVLPENGKVVDYTSKWEPFSYDLKVSRVDKKIHQVREKMDAKEREMFETTGNSSAFIDVSVSMMRESMNSKISKFARELKTLKRQRKKIVKQRMKEQEERKERLRGQIVQKPKLRRPSNKTEEDIYQNTSKEAILATGSVFFTKDTLEGKVSLERVIQLNKIQNRERKNEERSQRLKFSRRKYRQNRRDSIRSMRSASDITDEQKLTKIKNKMNFMRSWREEISEKFGTNSEGRSGFSEAENNKSFSVATRSVNTRNYNSVQRNFGNDLSRIKDKIHTTNKQKILSKSISLDKSMSVDKAGEKQLATEKRQKEVEIDRGKLKADQKTLQEEKREFELEVAKAKLDMEEMRKEKDESNKMSEEDLRCIEKLRSVSLDSWVCSLCSSVYTVQLESCLVCENGSKNNSASSFTRKRVTFTTLGDHVTEIRHSYGKVVSKTSSASKEMKKIVSESEKAHTELRKLKSDSKSKIASIEERFKERQSKCSELLKELKDEKKNVEGLEGKVKEVQRHANDCNRIKKDMQLNLNRQIEELSMQNDNLHNVKTKLYEGLNKNISELDRMVTKEEQSEEEKRQLRESVAKKKCEAEIVSSEKEDIRRKFEDLSSQVISLQKENKSLRNHHLAAKEQIELMKQLASRKEIEIDELKQSELTVGKEFGEEIKKAGQKTNEANEMLGEARESDKKSNDEICLLRGKLNKLKKSFDLSTMKLDLNEVFKKKNEEWHQNIHLQYKKMQEKVKRLSILAENIEKARAYRLERDKKEKKTMKIRILWSFVFSIVLVFFLIAFEEENPLAFIPRVLFGWKMDFRGF